jgi:hypothetical protein
MPRRDAPSSKRSPNTDERGWGVVGEGCRWVAS